MRLSAHSVSCLEVPQLSREPRESGAMTKWAVRSSKMSPL